MWTSDPDAQHYTIFSCSGRLQDDVCHVSVDFSVHMCAALFVCFTRVIVVPILLLCTQYWCPVSGACQDCNEMALIYFRCRSVVTVSTTVPAFDTSHEWMTAVLDVALPCLQLSSMRGSATLWILFFHWLLSSTDVSKRLPVSPVHFVMLSCQRVLGLPLLLWPEVVTCIISVSMQFPSFCSTWP